MIIAAVLALLALPLIVLRRRTLAAYYGVDAATWLFAWLLWLRMPGLDPYLGCVTIVVSKLATLSLFLARGRDVRWSANRAAVVAAIVYAIAIPSMLRVPIDGDEPFYLLLTESIVHDFDFDLANQYRVLERTASGRTDLVPQVGDPRGENGEQYSRHEPFLPLLMVPGYVAGGLFGAVATVALFGVLLVRSTIRWMEEEGVDDAAVRAVFPLFAFAPPVLFYATRIWPEVPAAFFFVEALRGVREDRMKRWLPALLGLVLLKLRFVLVAAGLIVAVFVRSRRDRRATALAAGTLLLPLLVMWLVTGAPTGVHAPEHLVVPAPERYAIGLFGLLADGMSGIAFRAPFYLLGLFALTRWHKTPAGFRLGITVPLLYLLALFPRGEWFGGWAPPLRYIAFIMPVLALGAASMWHRASRGSIAVVAAWTAALVIHGVAYPWRLFHNANGENAIGEWLSTLYRSDFSRLFPSFIRINDAAWVGLAAIILLLVVVLPRPSGRTARAREAAAIALFALALGAAFVQARQPASEVHFEDAHVIREGARLYPDFHTVMRVAYRGGRILETGDSLSFLAREGVWSLHYITGIGAMIEIGGRGYLLPPGSAYQTVRVRVPESGRVTLRGVAGAVNLDRMERHE